MKNFKEFFSNIQEALVKILVVFDIDDTLVHTPTKVNVLKNGRKIRELNSHEFTHYKLGPGEEFDFSNFRKAKDFFDNHKPIVPMIRQLKTDIKRGNKVVMVTARADFDDKETFLNTFRLYNIDMNKVHVYRAGNMKDGPKTTIEEKKKKIISELLQKDNYQKAIMYDDSKPNLQYFVSLKKDFPNTKFYGWHVNERGEASEHLREQFFDIVEKWSEKYKKTIDCNNPSGFSQRAHCQGREKRKREKS